MIRIDIDDREARQALERLQRKIGDLTPAMHDIGQELVKNMQDRIRDGRDADGWPFAPNSPATLARKRGGKPLIDRANFVANRLHYAAAKDAVEVGASAIQAAVLQFGAKKGEFGRGRRGAPIPWGDIPARPYLPLTSAGRLPEEDARTVAEVVAEYLAR